MNYFVIILDAVANSFSPDSTKLVSGTSDGTIRIWDIGTWRVLQKITGHESSVRAVTFSHDGTKIASGSKDGTVFIWNLHKGQDQKLRILTNGLTSGQKLLLYVLYCKYQESHSKKGIDLTEAEQELKEEYSLNLPELLNLKESYKSLPPELKSLTQLSFNVMSNEDDNSMNLRNNGTKSKKHKKKKK